MFITCQTGSRSRLRVRFVAGSRDRVIQTRRANHDQCCGGVGFVLLPLLIVACALYSTRLWILVINFEYLIKYLDSILSRLK